MSDRIRVLRLIEYEGDRPWVERTLLDRGLKGQKTFPHGTIREAILGELPEVMMSRHPELDELLPICVGCGKHPHEIDEYIQAGGENDLTPAEYVKLEDGTYNPENGHFACTPCYIKAGMPSSPHGWRAP